MGDVAMLALVIVSILTSSSDGITVSTSGGPALDNLAWRAATWTTHSNRSDKAAEDRAQLPAQLQQHRVSKPRAAASATNTTLTAPRLREADLKAARASVATPLAPGLDLHRVEGTDDVAVEAPGELGLQSRLGHDRHDLDPLVQEVRMKRLRKDLDAAAQPVVFCLFAIPLTLLLSWIMEHCNPKHHADADAKAGRPAEVRLPSNLWSLNLVAAVGQATSPAGPVPAYLVVVVSVIKGSVQMLALILLIKDIDPQATPVTTKPSDPWVHTAWSVNCMKWMMVLFMAVAMEREAGLCRVFTESVLLTNVRRLSLPRWVLLSMAFLHTVIMLTIVWGGVAVTLSLQSVPNILYSSTAIILIAKVDAASLDLVKHVFDIRGEFTIVHGRYEDRRPPKNNSARGPVQHGDNAASPLNQNSALMRRCQEKVLLSQEHFPLEDLVHHPISFAGYVLLRCIVVLPMVLALGLMGQAFITHDMPTKPVHVLGQDLFPWLF